MRFLIIFIFLTISTLVKADPNIKNLVIYKESKKIGDLTFLNAKNDKISLEQINALNPKGLIISPGPGKPSNSGVCIDLIKNS